MTLEHDGPDEDWPDEDWPGAGDWPEAASVPRTDLHGTEALRTRRWLRLLIVAVVALAAGAAGTLAVRDIAAGPAPATEQPAAGPSASIGAAQPGGQPPPGATGTMMLLAGTVRAVSSRSITIAAGPQSVTAAVTSSTRFAGKVSRIGQVRVGDMVMAQISESSGSAEVTALQDPASLS